MDAAELTGPVLWRAQPGAPPQWVEGGVYVWNGKVTRTKPAGVALKKISGTVIPGLCDVHAHIGIDASGYANGPDALEKMRTQGKAQLAAGVTAIRDCGSPVDNRPFQEQGDMPLLIRAGRHLARPKRYIRYLGLELEDPKELPQAIARQAAVGDGWVKIVGDWIDRSDGADSTLKPLWPAPILKDAVAAAHENGARVTVHTFSHEAIDDLLDAGVDCLEHGSGMDLDQMDQAARQGVPVTPTLLQVNLFELFAAQGEAKYPRYSQQMRHMHQRRYQQVADLVQAGVQLLPGTDSGGYQKHGSLPAELEEWRKAGLSEKDILDFATWKCRDFLRLPSLHPDAPADLVICDAKTPVVVMRNGKIVHQTEGH